MTTTDTAELDPTGAPDGENGSACHVQLDVFDGPLDLLLSLIKDQQLDIATVPLASVATQYLDYIRTMESLDVEIAAEYLVIAATLVFLKSKALLPPIPAEFLDDDAETPEMVEDRLRRRLIAYSKYRELGEELRERQTEASGYFYRDLGDPTSDVIQRYRVDPSRLGRAFIAMLQQARPEKRSIARERVSLLASMDYIAKRVAERGEFQARLATLSNREREVLFSELCKELGMHRETIVITFLAILELIRRHRISYEQPELFDDIRLFPYTKESQEA